MTKDSPQDLDWEREELILACDLVAENGWRQLSVSDPRVADLSKLLQRLPLHAPSQRRPNFRNANSVARKTADIATNRPGYAGRPTKGGRPTRRVIAEFIANPAVMHGVATALRQAEAAGEFVQLQTPVIDEHDAASEGRLLIRRHVVYERNLALRNRKLAAVRRADLPLACEACAFDFGQTYGERGNGYIECHHILPLHMAGQSSTRLADLALLCANCHRIIHARSPWITPTQLAELIHQQRIKAFAEVVNQLAGTPL